jgi:transcriptional regulator with XRE-family HTH domain
LLWQWPQFSEAKRQALVIKQMNQQRRLFGVRLYLLRNRLGLSQEEFSARCGMTKSYVSRIEGGSRFNPSYQIIERVMKAFPVNRNWVEFGWPPILGFPAFAQNLRDEEIAKVKALEAEEEKKAASAWQSTVQKIAVETHYTADALFKIAESMKDKAATSDLWRRARDMAVEVLMAKISLEKSSANEH